MGVDETRTTSSRRRVRYRRAPLAPIPGSATASLRTRASSAVVLGSRITHDNAGEGLGSYRLRSSNIVTPRHLSVTARHQRQYFHAISSLCCNNTPFHQSKLCITPCVIFHNCIHLLFVFRSSMRHENRFIHRAIS